LTPLDGLYNYRYVLSTERYVAQPLDQVSVTVDLDSSSGLSALYASDHTVAIEQLGTTQARVTWEAYDIRPTEDFQLFFAPAEGGFGGGLLTGQRAGWDHLLFLFAPQSNLPQENVLPKDILFVIDRSGSMSGDKLLQAQEALQFILSQLDPGDRFSIIGFDHRLSVFAENLQPVSDATIADARRFVQNITADGNTDIQSAVRTGLEILGRDESRSATRLLVFLTDGLPTAGVIDEALIANLIYETNAPIEARLHVFGVGYDVNTHLLDRLATQNGGTVTYVQPGENLETVLTSFYDRIARPVLTDLQIEFEGLVVSDLYPEDLPDLFVGGSLMLTGRYRATAPAVTVRVRGRAGTAARVYTYHFDLGPEAVSTTDRDFVPRLWATRRIGHLLDRVRVEGENPELVTAVQNLGLDYGLVTPYTTFVIQAQAQGAASAANMALYADTIALNQAWGQTTIQARVQNQLYQQAAQGNLAVGANVVNTGSHSLAQIAEQNVDLTLLRDLNLDGPVTWEWLRRHIEIDRIIPFGSPAYFDLAADPNVRAFLQAGANVIFEHQGEVVLVQDDPAVVTTNPASQQPTENWLYDLVWPILGALLHWFRF
jgi:Ca-activated chloride channel family protein